MYASYTNQLGAPPGPAAAHRAVLYAAEIVPRDGGARWCAAQGLPERHPVLGAHHIVQDRIYGGAEVI